MCKMCDIKKRFENHPKAQLAMDHNAIWQNALALRLNTMHFLSEVKEFNAFEYYLMIDEVFGEVIQLLKNIEHESFEICKGVIDSAK